MEDITFKNINPDLNIIFNSNVENPEFEKNIDIKKEIVESIKTENKNNSFINKIKEIKDFPNEIKNKILLDILQYKRRNYKLGKSKQQIYKFIKYNEMDKLSYNIDFDIYRIGDCILHRGKTNYSFREKRLYIRGWCIKCKSPNNELEDICKSCREVERYDRMAILADTGYKICHNCYERFKYVDWDKDKYCSWCLDTKIFYIKY